MAYLTLLINQVSPLSIDPGDHSPIHFPLGALGFCLSAVTEVYEGGLDQNRHVAVERQ